MNKIPKTNFKDLSFNISNYCISTCKYCNLNMPKWWQPDEEMSLKEIERFLTDPILDSLVTIHLTGGEPFLSPKLLAIADILHEHYEDTPINMPTNGLFPQLTYKLMKKIIKKLPQWRLNIGLEGPNRAVHESVRGLGSWDPVWETVSLLKPLGVPMVMNMTIFPENLQFIRETKELCDRWGIGFYLNFGRHSVRFGNRKDGIMWYSHHSSQTFNMENVISYIEEQIEDIGWLKQRMFNRRKWTIQKAVWRAKKVRFRCLAGIEGIDVFPNGDVYPCLMYFEDYKFGNIKEWMWGHHGVPFSPGIPMDPLTSIMNRDNSKKIQERIYSGDCSPNCPFTCVLRMSDLTIDGEEVKIE